MFCENKSLIEYSKEFNIPVIDENEIEVIDSKEHERIFNDLYDKMNNEQKEVADLIKNMILNKTIGLTENCVFIDGPGGSGKTFTYRAICHLILSLKKKYSCSAPTGIAATLLPEGQTIHSRFGLPVPLLSDSCSRIKPNTKAAKELIETDIFIIDEAPMASRYAFEIIDKLLRQLCNSDIAFAGKIILLGGDFRQVLPIQEYATQAQLINLSIKSSRLWKYFDVYKLIKNMRTDPKMKLNLLNI